MQPTPLLFFVPMKTRFIKGGEGGTGKPLTVKMEKEQRGCFPKPQTIMIILQ